MRRLVVVGDVLLDRDVTGTVERLCPDAPVPVVDEQETVERPGGAGLAALLAARERDGVTLVAPIAGDRAGRTLRRMLADRGVDTVAWRDPGATREKERVHVDGRPIVRLDRGGRDQVLGEPPRAVCELIGRADAVLVADYGAGAAADAAVRSAIAAAAGRGTPVVWDPHPRGLDPVPRVTLATPNLGELFRFDPLPSRNAPAPESLDAVLSAARRVLAGWRAGGVSVTRGVAGALLVTGDGAPLVVPVDDPSPATADACGAGDAFAAACACALAAGAVPSEAVQRAVWRAADFVRAGGALGLAGVGLQTPGPEPAGHGGRVIGTVVATGGCFDLLHAGHVATLQRARLLGDRLVVLLNGDESVRRLKGPGRPLQPATDRAAVLRSLSCVDEVIVFDEDTPIEALRALRPDVFVKGGDYSSARLPETAVLAEWGGSVVTVPYLAGRSTSGLVEQIGSGRA